MRKFPRLRVFVSSRMAELTQERELVRAALDKENIDAWVFEKDAGARPESIQETFLKELARADLYIGIFWKGYGSYTIDEYEHAIKLKKTILIYEKRFDIENNRDPQLQSFLDRAGKPETGHTIQWFNTTEELIQCIKSDIDAWLVETSRKKTSKSPKANLLLSLTERKERDSQLNLLQKVKSFWIDGVLKQSVHSEALIILGKQKWNEANIHPWKQTIELPDQTPSANVGQSNIETFIHAGRSLLILGEPGSGKTMTLLDIAQGLIEQAESDPSKGIPVVFNLSSWVHKRESIFDWAVEELNTKYQIPKKAGVKWLNENNIILLLDGLDEVKTENRAACVNAINVLIAENLLLGIVVTSRIDEYKNLSEQLKLSRIIQLQPLTMEQVDGYIARSGDKLDGLRQVLKTDNALKTLAETPLMLDVMSIAYHDIAAESLSDENLNTPQARRKHLFDTYIDKMFKRKGQREKPYSQEKMVNWLGWLANGMQSQNQSIFFVHELNSDWFKSKQEKQKFELIQTVFTFMYSRISWLIIFLIAGPFTLIFLLFFGLNIHDPLNKSPSTTNLVLHWSRKEAYDHMASNFRKSLLLAIPFILLFLYLYYKDQPIQSLNFSLLLLAYIILHVMFGVFFNGLKKEPLDIKHFQKMPDIVIKNLLILAIGGFIYGAITGLLLGGLVVTLISAIHTSFIFYFAFLYAVLTGIALCIWYTGPFIVRTIAMLGAIIFTRRGPFSYFLFLEYATNLVFLRRVGIGYIFIHRLLLEHFATIGKKG